ncbi:MAG: polysaccharide deacetylase family protein [Paenibacillaceae bacterium]
MGKTKKWITISLMFVTVLWGLSQSSSIESYLSKVKADPRYDDRMAAGDTFLRMDTSERQQWNDRITKEAQKLRIEPVNAVIDRVWKAIPGYNGLEVDMDKTLKLAMDQPLNDHIPFVFKEIEPMIQLEDLAPNAIYKGNPHKPMVAFMVNVAWGNEFIPDILSVFREENVKATFFIDGSWLSNNEDIARTILKEGHELSNHAYTHRNMSSLNDSQIKKEIQGTEQLLEKIGVTNNQWFAPPSGDYDQQTVRVAHQLGLRTVLWTIDTVDWKKPNPDWIIRRIDASLEPGAMILMHPTESSSKALKRMIQKAKQRNLAVGTVSDLLSSKRVTAVESAILF